LTTPRTGNESYLFNSDERIITDLYSAFRSEDTEALGVISVEVRVQDKIPNEPHEVSRVEHKQGQPEDRTLGNSTA